MKTSMINDKYAYENSLTDMNVSNVWTHYWHILEPLKSCPKYDQTFGHFKFSKNHLMVPKECPKFGHFLDIFWAYHAYLDMLSNLSVRCPKFIKPLDIFLDIFNRIGRILGTFWTYLRLWTYFGHIMDTFGLNVSKMCPSPHRAGAPRLWCKRSPVRISSLAM